MLRHSGTGQTRRGVFAHVAPLALLGLAAFSRSAHGQTYYWDVNGANPGASDGTTASGTFGGANWTTDSTGSSATTTYPSTTPRRPVVFSAGSNATGVSTVNVASSASV